MRKALVGVMMAGSLVLANAGAAPANAASQDRAAPNALANIHRAVRMTEEARSAHFSNLEQEQLPSIPPSAAWTVGDLTFPGPNVSATIWQEMVGLPNEPPLEEIVVGDHVYDRLGGSPSDPWAVGTIHGHFPFLGLVGTNALDRYRGPVGTLGPDTVNGVPTIEYSIQMPGITKTFSFRGSRPVHIRTKPFHFYVWLDISGRILQTSAHVVEVSDQQALQVWDVQTLSDFGEPVTITPPANASSRPLSTSMADSLAGW